MTASIINLTHHLIQATPSESHIHGVGGYITGTHGANPAIILNGTTEVRFSPVFQFQFIGVIDASAAGFTHFEFRELDGKIGQPLFIFGDDFTFTGAPFLADGDLAPWDNPDGLINAADVLIATQLILGLRIPGDLQYAHGEGPKRLSASFSAAASPRKSLTSPEVASRCVSRDLGYRCQSVFLVTFYHFFEPRHVCNDHFPPVYF